MDAEMDKTTNAPRTLILSVHLYQALLAIFPSDFRRAYGGPMLQVFRDSCLRALRENGAAGLLPLWGRTMLDAVQTAIEEHSQRGVDMSREKFIKLSGWALMLGGLAVMLGWLAGTRPDYNRFNARSLPIDRYLNFITLPLIVLGLLLLCVGFIGLFLRYGREMGRFGRYSLGAGALSGVVAVIGGIGLSISDSELWWSLLFFGMGFQYLGLALFGITNLRQRTLPRWNALPVLAGGGVPLIILVSFINEQVNGGWVELPQAVYAILFLLSLIAVVGMGYLLQADSQRAGVVAPAI